MDMVLIQSRFPAAHKAVNAMYAQDVTDRLVGNVGKVLSLQVSTVGNLPLLDVLNPCNDLCFRDGAWTAALQVPCWVLIDPDLLCIVVVARNGRGSCRGLMELRGFECDLNKGHIELVLYIRMAFRFIGGTLAVGRPLGFVRAMVCCM